MILALLALIACVALVVAALAAQRILSPWRRRRRLARIRRTVSKLTYAQPEPGSPGAEINEQATRAYATADAKRRQRFAQRYAQAMAKDGINPALAADEAARIYAEINSLGVT